MTNVTARVAARSREGASPMYPLLLSCRMLSYPPSSKGLSFDHVVGTDAQRFADAYPHLFSVSGEDPKYLSAIAPKPTLRELAHELYDDAKENGYLRPMSDFELLASVLAWGEVRGKYGPNYWTRQISVVHLFSSGIDWSKFHGVGDEHWSVWGGIFAEDTLETKLAVTLYTRCSCTAFRHGFLSFGLKLPSLAVVFSVLDAGVLEKLFDR